MLRYSIPLMPTTIMWWVVNVSDTFMVSAIIGISENGVYSFAYKFPNLAAILVGIFMQAWNMSAITERNSRTVSKFYSNVFHMMQTVCGRRNTACIASDNNAAFRQRGL